MSNRAGVYGGVPGAVLGTGLARASFSYKIERTRHVAAHGLTGP